MGRADVGIVSQFGIETTPGTTVAATRTFNGLEITVDPEFEIYEGRASGRKYKTVAQKNKEWSKGTIEGPAQYSEMHSLLKNFIGATVGSQIGTTGAYPWTVSPSISAADSNRSSFTLRHGDGDAAVIVPNFNITELSFEFADQPKVSGTWIGQKLAAGSLTSNVPQLAAQPISRNDIKIFLDDDSADIGTTALASPIMASVKFGTNREASWVLNRDNASWKDLTETAIEVTGELQLIHDSTSRSLYTSWNTDELPFRYMRIDCNGANIGTNGSAAVDYQFYIDLALRFTGAKENRKASGAVYAYTYSFSAHIDPDWSSGKAWGAYLVNKSSAAA